MPRICISYRRADSTAIAGRIYDRLVSRYGAESVFMDVSDIPYGADFREHIQKVFRDTRVLIALIGPEWLGDREKRAGRIQDQNDPIRVEIQTALHHQIDVIPVLIDQVKMPAPESLPPDIQEFAFRNAMRVDSGIDFHPHIERLMAHIDQSMPNANPAAQPVVLSLALLWCSKLLPYVLATVVLLLLAHYLIVMKLDTDPIYLRFAAMLISLGCGFALFRGLHVGVGAAAMLGLCVSVIAVLGMTTTVGVIDGHGFLPAGKAEWQEAFEYLVTITLATAAGNLLARLAYATVPGRSGKP